MKNNKKGFTLAELLVVVGILAVLVAISIPVFSGQVEKSAEAVDAANIRSAYAEIMTAAAQGDTPASKEVKLTQKENDWQTDVNEALPLTESGTPAAGGTVTLTYDSAKTGNEAVTATYSAAAE